MKIGSVKFFKVLILSVLALFILVPTVLACVFGFLYSRTKERADNLEKATLAEMGEIAAMLNQNARAQEEDGTTSEAPPLFSFGEPGLESALPSFFYQQDYPHLYANRPLLQEAKEKVCYLTFDDGPSPVTTQVLEVLEAYNIKATFFVTGENSTLNEDVLKAASAAGHSIGVHSYSHNYETIYESVDSYLADFNQMYRRVREVTGKAPDIFRFPGGSVNVYNRLVFTPLIAEMTRRGFSFYDWNASGEDAVEGGIGAAQITSNVLQSAAGKSRLVVLLHDRNDRATTAAALPGIIEGLQAQGYSFEALTGAVEPITFFYNGNS